MDAPAALHPTDQTLSSYGLGKLDEAAAGAIHRHLETCPDCRRRVAELSSDSFLSRLRDARGSATGSDPGTGRELPATQPPASTLPPDLADHPDYQILRELGRGGMGVVYLAHNRLMGRDEVLKVVGKHLLDRRGVMDRFLREIRSAARLHHPNIVTAYSAFRIGAGIVFAMEYVEGLDLSKMVKSRGMLPVANAAYYLHQVALGLQAAHEQGMVHRDIKPGNLMLARKGERAVIKVLDFGLAKATREDPLDGGLTHQGQMLGTPDYIAPEQITDAQSADIRADIYSLGCTAYYLLSGGPPFRGPSLYDLLQAHHSMDARPLNLARTDVPVELAALVAKMMAKEPHRRFQSPDEVAKALTPFFKAGKIAPGAPRPEPSQASPSQAVTETSRAISTPTRPATLPPPTARPVEGTPRPEAMWASLIDLKETAQSREATPARVRPRRRRPPWAWPAMAAGVLLSGMALAWAAGVLRVKTPDGVIVLENVPKDSEILVDGKTLDIKWPGVGEPWKIRAVPGQRRVEVRKDGFKTFGEVVTVKTDGSEEVTVRLEPLAEDPSGKDEEGTPQAKTGASLTVNPEPTKGRLSGAEVGGAASARSAASLAKAPPDSTLFEGDRYKVFHELLSWHEARDKCEEMGGHLAIVKGENENRFLTSLVASAGLDAAWLGATDERAEGRWVWVDGTELRYENWDASRVQPNNRAPWGEAEHYMLSLVSRKGAWWDLPDHAEKQFHPGFVCEWGDNDTGSSNKRPGAGTIPGDARPYAGKLFKVYREEMTWHAARIRCEEMGGSLAVVGDADENRFLRTLLAAEDLKEAWLGASDERVEGRWVWVDGTEMRFDAWDSGQPTNGSTWGSVEHYLLMAAVRNGAWNDVPNGGERSSHAGFVCQWEAAAAPRAGGSVGSPTSGVDRPAQSLVGEPPVPPAAAISNDLAGADFVSLFNGKDLTGWLTPDDRGLFAVEKGQIVGRAKVGQLRKNEYLVFGKPYGDFVLKAKVRYSNGNSGIHFRSRRDADGSVSGPQADIGDGSWGLLYEERGRGILERYPEDKANALVKRGDWNQFVITAKGDHVTIDLNGTRIIDRGDSELVKSGVIGLQLHVGPPMEVRFKDIEIKELGGDGPSPGFVSREPSGPLGNDDGFRPLFNGRDLAGWTAYDDRGKTDATANWKVSEGVLHGWGGRSHLFSTRGDFRDFRVRAQVRINDGGNSGLYFRVIEGPGFPAGYEAQINSTHSDPRKTGSLYRVPMPPIVVASSPVPPDSWFTLEAEAVGGRIRIWVDGKQYVDWTDSQKSYPRGHIALQCYDPSCHVQFRKLEVLELGPEAGLSPTKATGRRANRRAGGPPSPNLADTRRHWVHETGDFRIIGPGEWEERSPNGLTYRYKEIDRTKDRIELDALNGDTAIRYRLYDNRCDQGKKPVLTYTTLFTGGWAD